MDETFILRQLSQNFKELHSSLGLPIEVIASKCDMSTSTFKNYLYGINMPSIETLISICSTINIPIKTFFNHLVDFQTEDLSIQRISGAFKGLSTFRQEYLKASLEPLVSSVAVGTADIMAAKFGTRLKVVRNDYGITIKAIADKCGVDTKTIRAYESTQSLPGIPIFLNICRELKVSPGYMLYNHLPQCHQYDKCFYLLTPRVLEGLAITVERLCNFLKE